MIRRGARADLNDLAQWSIDASQQINDIAIGQSENTFVGTLRANETTSTFTDGRIKFGSAVIPVPMSANAALAELYQFSTANGTVTFTHDNTADTDRTFRFVICGGPPPPTRTAT
jgi:hypothetical protein